MGQLKKCNQEPDALSQFGKVVIEAFDNSSFADLIETSKDYSKISDFVPGFGRVDKIGNVVVETATNQILCATDQSYNKPTLLGLNA